MYAVFHPIWKKLHLTENFYTSTACDKYEVYFIFVQTQGVSKIEPTTCDLSFRGHLKPTNAQGRSGGLRGRHWAGSWTVKTNLVAGAFTILQAFPHHQISGIEKVTINAHFVSYRVFYQVPPGYNPGHQYRLRIEGYSRWPFLMALVRIRKWQKNWRQFIIS